jgi:beta-glucosidase
LGTSLTSLSVTPVPGSALRGPNNERGLKAEFFANKTLAGAPVLTRIDQAVNFDWGTGSPAPAVPPDEFSVRWTGKLVPAVSGKYHFGRDR